MLDQSVDKVQSKIGFVRSNPWMTEHFVQSLICGSGGFRSVLFVLCFKVHCSVIAPVLGNNQLVKFATQMFLTFLILVTCKNNETSASFL